MNGSNIFELSNKVKDLNVSIGEYRLKIEMIGTFEITYSNKTPKVTCELSFSDMYDINALVVWDETNVKISYVDLFDEFVEKEFNIVNIVETFDTRNQKIISLELQDIFSYKIEKCITPKGFKGNIVSAFEDYIEFLGLTEYPKEFESFDAEIEFCVPGNCNHLKWLMFELSKYGLLLYQNKEKVFLKHIDNLVPSTFPEQSDKFVTTTNNKLYQNIIHDVIPSYINRNKTPIITRAMAFDPLTKKMVYSTDSDKINSKDELLINNDNTDYQDNTGFIDVYQTHLDFNETRNKNRESFINTNEMIIVVNGYKKNDINQIYNILIHGHKGSVESYADANLIVNGKWVSTKVVDKVVGDSLLQKITLQRADMVKK